MDSTIAGLINVRC